MRLECVNEPAAPAASPKKQQFVNLFAYTMAIPTSRDDGMRRPMPIQSGTHLGPYEIISAIGAGGMGEADVIGQPQSRTT